MTLLKLKKEELNIINSKENYEKKFLEDNGYSKEALSINMK